MICQKSIDCHDCPDFLECSTEFQDYMYDQEKEEDHWEDCPPYEEY